MDAQAAWVALWAGVVLVAAASGLLAGWGLSRYLLRGVPRPPTPKRGKGYMAHHGEEHTPRLHLASEHLEGGARVATYRCRWCSYQEAREEHIRVDTVPSQVWQVVAPPDRTPADERPAPRVAEPGAPTADTTGDGRGGKPRRIERDRTTGGLRESE